MPSPKPRTPEEGVPFLTRLMRHLPGRGDARLQMPVDGTRDPRLPLPTQMDLILEGLDRVQDLAQPSASFESLQGLKRTRRR